MSIDLLRVLRAKLPYFSNKGMDMRFQVSAFTLSVAFAAPVLAGPSVSDFNTGAEVLLTSIGELQACSVVLPFDASKYASAADDHHEALVRLSAAAGLSLSRDTGLVLRKISLGRRLASMSLEGSAEPQREAQCERAIDDARGARSYLTKLVAKKRN